MVGHVFIQFKHAEFQPRLKLFIKRNRLELAWDVNDNRGTSPQML